jgi:stress-induced morphogen
MFVSGLAGGEDTVVSRCTQKISSALNPIKISVTSTNDDPNGNHIQVLCVSAEFEGKSIIQRQRLVYKAIWEELNGPVHAVDSIVAKTPKEAGL